MNKKELFSFLIGEEVNYIFKKTNGKVMFEEKGILGLSEDDNLVVYTKTKNITINLNKAQDINIVELADYVEVTYLNSVVELRRSTSQDNELDFLYESLEDNIGNEICVTVIINNNEVFSQAVGILAPCIFEDEYFDIETENGFRQIIDVKNIVSIKRSKEDDELLFIVKMKNNLEIIIGFITEIE